MCVGVGVQADGQRYDTTTDDERKRAEEPHDGEGERPGTRDHHAGGVLWKKGLSGHQRRDVGIC